MNIDSLKNNMESKADPKQAEVARKYMKSRLEFYGLKIPIIRKLVGDFVKYQKASKGGISLKGLYPELKKLWESRVFELMAAALFILERFNKNFDDETWELMDKWIDDIDNWALCDWLCTLRVQMVDKDRKKLVVLMEWARSPHIWRRRSALISILKLKRFQSSLTVNDIKPIIMELIDEKEFFIQKAIGWLLRSYGDFEPEAVMKFANENKGRMSKLAYKEATRKIKPLK